MEAEINMSSSFGCHDQLSEGQYIKPSEACGGGRGKSVKVFSFLSLTIKAWELFKEFGERAFISYYVLYVYLLLATQWSLLTLPPYSI